MPMMQTMFEIQVIGLGHAGYCLGQTGFMSYAVLVNWVSLSKYSSTTVLVRF